MPTMSALRNSPHFAHLFAKVFVLCWPILVWQINRMMSWSIREGYPNFLYSVNRWGFITIVYLGDKHDPQAYKPLPRTFRPLTDASYASDLPTNLNGRSPLDAAITLTDGPVLRSLRRSRKGAPPPPPNTS